MGLLSWLFGGSDDSKSSQRGPFYYSRLENMEKIREARERWGKTQKELYRKGGTTALGLTTGSDEDSIDEDTDSEADEQEQEEYEDTVNELIDERENLREDIETYKADKANAINHYPSP